MLEIKPIFNSLLRSKAGAIMLLIQIAITTAIVSNAAFIAKDRIDFLSQETGYPEDEIFSFTTMTFDKELDIVQKFEETETMLRNIPGVKNASLFNAVPLSGSGSAGGLSLKPATEEGPDVRAAYFLADENALDTLGVNLLEGRNFRPDEVIMSASRDVFPEVTIITQALGLELFPTGDALGKTVYFGVAPLKIIGIAEPMKSAWLKDSRPDNVSIIPFVGASIFQKIIVRTEPEQRTAIMRQIEDLMIQDHNKRVIIGLQGMDEDKRDNNASDILMLRMLITLIIVLVLITGLGIFGLTVFNINKRTKQIGTRRALGARKSAIVRYFLIENAIICVFGLVLGSIAAIFMGQLLLENYSMPALDTFYVLMTALFVFIASLLSVVMPATKAANISPSIATRSI
ncbi:FtsX-like permease family protein [Psychrosphaera sp. B3R10]|uniref:ABC transporter permease n=1 Tax=unclassified Psychrosphaera TaxID=2641570 RepID=UPI001C07FFDC|nr:MULTISPECIES: FtsX-like permease family protein [unclassified Psychrosphaera]MBU2882757.1 FtsX-like permease family protein [Psychrosphaera sp. I2R16]MBU2989225.1 FtsX-like permease family protein [Psychrosphaera sp. B3R10]MDO6719109.1 FtsX-like permease family protein [Psychrosphaera sp. 1_MG-2023]